MPRRSSSTSTSARPCLDEVALERLVKKLVARSCTERAPVELRQRVVFSIRQVQLEVTQMQIDPTDRQL